MAKTTERVSRGRPKSEEKRKAILDAARMLLLEHGYSQTSMDMVAAAAGVGKPTVYGHFGSKEELFAAIIAVRRKKLMKELHWLENPTSDPRKDMERFAFQFQKFILVPSARRWDRLVIAEAGRHPQLARRLFKAGPSNVLRMLEQYLGAQTAMGRLQVTDTALAAEHFLGLCFGAELIRGQMASQPKRTDAERKRRAKSAVAVFLAAYASNPSR